jgi:hypothetical protein
MALGFRSPLFILGLEGGAAAPVATIGLRSPQLPLALEAATSVVAATKGFVSPMLPLSLKAFPTPAVGFHGPLWLLGLEGGGTGTAPLFGFFSLMYPGAGSGGGPLGTTSEYRPTWRPRRR